MGWRQRLDWIALGLALGMAALAVAFVTSPAPARSRTQPQASAPERAADPVTTPSSIRVGYFPNITHAQALIGNIRGDFQQALGPDIKLTTATFNAGPSLIEALYAGHLDLAYVGPSPAINGYLRSEGAALTVVSGSANNGILVIGNSRRGITRLDQLPSRRIATPQFGNTQDISAKSFLTEMLGARLRDRGGDTDIFPMANPDIEILFEKDQIDAAWVPEPWGSRIIRKGLANLVAEEKDLWPGGNFPLTSVVARRDFLGSHPELVQRFLVAHIRITRELAAAPESFADLLNQELKRLTGKALPRAVVLDSLKHTRFTTDPSQEAYETFFHKARRLRLVKGEASDLAGLITTGPLEAALAATALDGSPEASGSQTTQTLSHSPATTGL